MRGERILILGGTGEARELATSLVGEGLEVISSLAGVTGQPRLPDGEVRSGGFGGIDGLAAYLVTEAIAVIIDATHPFAAQMSRQACEAAEVTGVPLLRLERAPWHSVPGDNWITAADAREAADLLPAGSRPFVTIGRKEVAIFLSRGDLLGLARMIEVPPCAVPPNWTIQLQRPPFAEQAEITLLTQNLITHVVTKNSGSVDTFAKIVAARRLGIPVVMISRPPKPAVPTFPAVNEILPAVRRVLLP
jgi:precorrin-6A/cobalt-precorrin-6A reductase